MWTKREKNPFYTLFQVLLLWSTFRVFQVIKYRRNRKRDIGSETDEPKMNQTPDWVILSLSLFSSAVLSMSILAEMQAGLHSPFWENDLRPLAWWSSTKTGSIFSRLCTSKYFGNYLIYLCSKHFSVSDIMRLFLVCVFSCVLWQ